MKNVIAYPLVLVAFLLAAGGVFVSARAVTETDIKLLAAEDIFAVVDMPLPVRLRIPKIGVDAQIEEVGVNEKGEMAVPKDIKDVGWYMPGTVPGARGQAVVDGHLDNYLGEPLVFARLAELEEGDDVYVINEKGAEIHFKVIGEKTYPFDFDATEEIFGPTDDARLNLITCQGTWVQSEHSYDERTVVFTERI